MNGIISDRNKTEQEKVNKHELLYFVIRNSGRCRFGMFDLKKTNRKVQLLK